MVDQILVDSISLKDPGYSIEEVIYLFNNQLSLREEAVNTIKQLGRKSAVQELCTLIKGEENLRVLARTTLAVEKLTEAKFLPLEYEKVQLWWTRNQDNPEFHGSYDGYLKVRDKIAHSSMKTADLPSHIKLLEETIESDPKALHARCLKAGLFIILGNDQEAENELKEVEAINSNYVWLDFWRSALALKQERREDAIALLNKALERSPARVEHSAKIWKMFHSLLLEKKVHWPDAEKAETKE